VQIKPKIKVPKTKTNFFNFKVYLKNFSIGLQQTVFDIFFSLKEFFFRCWSLSAAATLPSPFIEVLQTGLDRVGFVDWMKQQTKHAL
jgi:hypothetical protein